MNIAPHYMLDTNICIYIQRQKPASVLEHFKKIPLGQAVISTITWGELLYGAMKSRRTQQVLATLDDFTALVPVCAMPPECGRQYGKIRADLEKRGQPIGNNDLWIAAHAMVLNLTVVSNNVSEFMRIPHLKVENWV